MPIHKPSRTTKHWLASMALTLLSATAHAETWVITDHAHPVSVPTGVRIIRLDDQQRLEELLSQQLLTINAPGWKQPFNVT